MEYFKFLPEEITLDILTRLPTDSSLECKSVCKPWNNLISYHPLFSKMQLHHLIHPSDSAADDSGKSFLASTYEACLGVKRFLYFEYNETTHETNIRRVDLTPPQLNFYFIVGSCNGLICSYNELGSIIVWNPIIKEYVVFPEQSCDKRFFFGFGYLPMTDEYKIVRMYQLLEEPKTVEVQVYTLGSGKGWRYLGKIDCGFKGRIGVFANGALHWLYTGKQMIVSFNLADEKFYDVPLPPISQRCSIRLWFNLSIWVLGDYLMCIDDKLVEGVRTIDRWLLKKNNGLFGMKSEVDCNWVNWSKEFRPDDMNMTPFSFTNSGAVLCIKNLSWIPSLHCYDVKSSPPEKLASFGDCFYQLPTTHMNTLVSLKSVGEENTKKMELILGTKSRSLAEKQ